MTFPGLLILASGILLIALAIIPEISRRNIPVANMVAALRYLEFRILWLSTVCVQVGQGMQQVLMGWLMFEITGSAAMVGAVFAARSAPHLVVGILAGALADRLDRRLLMRVTVLGMMLFPLAAGFLDITGKLAVWHLLLGATALGTLEGFYLTARQVYVFDIVGREGAINGIAVLSMAQRVGGIIGALAAGAVIQRWGPGTAFLAMGTSYGLGLLALLWLRRAGESVPQSREAMGQILAGYFNALKSNRALVALMITTAAAEILGLSHQVVLPIMAKDVLHVGPAGLGLLTAARFFGGALGVFVGVAMGQVRRRGMMLLIILALFGGCEMLLSQAPNLGAAMALVTLINIMGSATDILHQTLMQMNVPNEQRGRAMGAWIVGVGTGPLGQMEVGYLSGLASSRIALLVNGAALATGALVLGVLIPRLRRL